jgi:hypothetical protein
MGGATAIGYALKHADRLRSLTLVSSGAAGYAVSKKFERLDGLARAEGVEVARQKWMDWSLAWYKDRHPEVGRRIAEMMNGYSGAVWADPMRGKYPKTVDLDRVSQIKTPTLIMAGELDKVFLELAKKFHERIAGSRLKVFPGVGQERLEKLEEFRSLYSDYAKFTNRPENVPAQMVRQKMEPLVPMTVDSLRRVGLGQMVTRDAPVRGGKKVRINLIRAIFRDHIVRQFSLDDDAPMKLLDAGILKYRQRLWRQKLQLVNPLFWLFHLILFLARLPLLAFRAAGFESDEYEKAPIVRLYLVVFQMICWALLAHWLGLWRWIWFDIVGA